MFSKRLNRLEMGPKFFRNTRTRLKPARRRLEPDLSKFSKFSNLGRNSPKPKISDGGPGSNGSWIPEPDSDLIGPKMNIQDAIKIKLLQWENEFERVEHF